MRPQQHPYWSETRRLAAIIRRFLARRQTTQPPVLRTQVGQACVTASQRHVLAGLGLTCDAAFEGRAVQAEPLIAELVRCDAGRIGTRVQAMVMMRLSRVLPNLTPISRECETPARRRPRPCQTAEGRKHGALAPPPYATDPLMTLPPDGTSAAFAPSPELVQHREAWGASPQPPNAAEQELAAGIPLPAGTQNVRSIALKTRPKT